MSAQEKDRVKSFPSDVGAILKRVCKGGRSSCLGKGQKGPKRKYTQSILANVKQNVSLLKEGLQDHALLCKSLYFPRKVENCSRDLLEFAKNMKMWYVRLVFVFIFYINSNEHENQYLLWHGHLLLSSLA